MSNTEPADPLVPLGRLLLAPVEPARARLASLVARSAVATLVLTNVHHVYGAHRYSTSWRLHVLLVTIPAIFVILASRRRLLRSPSGSAAWWVFVLTTLVVPVLGIGAFEGVYNHLVKDALFVHGASAELMARLFPSPTYEMPNDAFFEITGVAQVVPGTAAAWFLHRFARPRITRSPRRASTFVRSRSLATLSDQPAWVPDPAGVVHLQFRRFAGCPVCNLHLRTFVRRHDELRAANVREVVVFHSSADELREHAADLPFAVVPDPDKVLYAEFGVESSPRAVLDPRAWGAILRGVARSLIASLRGRERLPAIRPHGGGLGLPGDFLIAPDGRVMASKYGAHADDQWSVDDVLALTRGASGPHAGAA